MLALRGTFDGKHIKLADKKAPSEPQDVIITFLGSESEDDMKARLKSAAEALAEDYKHDTELTAFSSIDSDSFYE